MNKIIALLLLITTQACAQNHGLLEPLGRFPKKLKEVSGIETATKGTFWVIEDSGNKDEIYRVDKSGKIKETLKIDHAKNKDWEDLTLDAEGNLYIGDFGNNANERDDLVIYKISKSQLDKKEPNAEKIKISYPQQTDFPPKKDSLYYDTEGMFHWDGYLYIFTKNRTRPYSGKTLIYRVPDKKGEYKAELLSSLFLCDDQNRCSVTSVDLSPNGKTIALLTYGKLILLRDFKLPDFSTAITEIIDLQCTTQIESVVFTDNNTVLIADEQNKFGGRKIYQFTLD
ncbi:hypothetical protein [Flagellimonas zhangzhouensis]|uniref:SdiA-regulated n=1 Tax=Flagellimonas zhangzhouensis TaxID=1073328 RepID=A0A1H2VI28_9FLAO|nr:hypothetical protein [Allomuricauda zhangzhouensis]SDQ07661.1 hypothetical protein SAMN05216294_0200 [Allomuricauda zhangzhouensis]SDW68016.1 hypothetical protein SAMN04487892_2093 [Allomuricauda zhangzhouensis]